MSDTGEFEESEDHGTLSKDAQDDDDDEFEFNAVTQPQPASAGNTELVSNQHFDEALSVSDEESIADSVSMDQSPKAAAAPAAKPDSDDSDGSGSDESDGSGSDESDETDETDDDDAGQSVPLQSQPTMTAPPSAGPSGVGNGDSDDEGSGSGSGSGSSTGDESSSSDESGDGDDGGPSSKAKMYDPADYAHLKVSSEIQDLFDYIPRHKPNDIELDTKLHPFIPDFIPAVGDIDAFIKVPPPDGKSDGLGLTVLDEPAATQSDPTVLDLQLRIISKRSGLKPVTVHSIENADKHPLKIQTWINNIEDVHRKKPPPTVNYSKNMPDIEALMQVWPEELERLLKDIPLPSAEMDLDLAQFSKVVCAMLDIPVYDKITESLHVLFTLYSEFKNNAHFQQ